MEWWEQKFDRFMDWVSRTLLYWRRNLPKDICGPGRGWQKFKRLRDRIKCGQKYGQISEKQRKDEERQEWANEKPKLENARRMKGIYFIDRKMKNISRPSNMQAKRLEVQMEAAMS